MKLQDGLRDLVGEMRNARCSIETRRQEHGVRGAGACRGLDLEPRRLLLDRENLDILANGRIHLLPERLKVVENLRLHHEPVRVRSVVSMAGQLALPVGSDEAKSVPSFAPPFVHGGLLFEHDVIEPGAAQPIAGGETGLTASDDDGGIVRQSARAHRSTSSRKRLQRTIASGSLSKREAAVSIAESCPSA